MKPAVVDRLLLGIGAAALLGTLAWAAFGAGGETFTQLAARSGSVGERPWQPVTVPPVDPQVRVWQAPAAQTRDARWLFEVFTPPIIYFDTHANPPAFTVVPPLAPGTEVAPPPFGLELLATERQLYRLQYQGMVGDLFMLDHIETGVGINLREGQRSAEAAVTLVSGRAERRVITPEDPAQTPTIQNVVTVVLRDERLGELVELSSLGPRFNPRVQARVRTNGAESTVGEGDRLESGGVAFVIRRIDLDPPRVTVEKSIPGEAPETRQLAPVP